MDNINDLPDIFLTAEKLYKEIDELVWEEDISYIEATTRVCESKNIDLEDIKKLKLVAPILFDKIRTEALHQGMLKPESSLPV